jgi:hypothetical protein
MWELSSKFRVEDNDSPDFKEGGIYKEKESLQHPFLGKML